MNDQLAEKITDSLGIIRELVEKKTGHKVLVCLSSFNPNSKIATTLYAASECSDSELSKLYFEMNAGFFHASKIVDNT